LFITIIPLSIPKEKSELNWVPQRSIGMGRVTLPTPLTIRMFIVNLFPQIPPSNKTKKPLKIKGSLDGAYRARTGDLYAASVSHCL